MDGFSFEELQKLPQVRFSRVFSRLPKTVQCVWQECKQQADVLSEWSPFWETVPGQSMRETGKAVVQNKDKET